MTRTSFLLAIVVLLSLCTSASAAAPAGGDWAEGTIRAAGVTGGVIVHLGCGDGRRTAALHKGEGFCVHGLDTDPANVREARACIQSLGLYGPVAVDTFDGTHLPYVDGMVNLLVADTLGKVPMTEVFRVLAPEGVALVAGKRTVRPRPKTIDEWTHYLHDADNNAVAQDTVVGPPRRLQWQCGPKWTRHHDKMSSFSAMVSSGGRIFYILDEGSTASIHLPSHWALIARDAFNGKRLWRRPIDTWYSRYKGLKDGPADAPRRLIARDGKVWATLDLHGPLTCLDAADGKTLRQYPGTKGAEEVLLSDGVLFLLIGPGSIGDGRRLERPVEKRKLLAVRAETGKELWSRTDIVAALTPAVDAEHLYYFNFASQHVVCLDRATGRERWTSETLPTPKAQKSFFASKLVVRDGVVLFASGEYSGMIKSTGGATQDDTLTALSASTGKTLWHAAHPPSGYSSPENVFVIDGTVWCDKSSNGNSDGTVVGYDLKTGQVRARFPADQTSYWFHHRCYPGRATSNYLITSRTGAEFIDFRAKKWDLNHWARGACLYGLMPANGLLYTPPAPCACYEESMLHSFNALAPAAAAAAAPPAAPALTKGPAYGSIDSSKSATVNPRDWPTYRGDASRSGTTASAVPAPLTRAWSAEIGGRLSSVTVADGKLFVAAVDRHAVVALDAGSGKEIWQYTAGGRVDSPPTIAQGRVLFGSADGSVYCLRAADGELAWRFRAGPADRRILAYEQIESLWPVHGSVLVRGGEACFVAGRSSFVDGGMRLVRLDAATGRVLSRTTLDERNPKTGKNIQDTVKWLNMAVTRPDVLSCDGERIYMRSQSFDLAGKRLALGPTRKGPSEGTQQGGKGTHLFCPAGFLDDTSFHRTYWMYGKTWSSGWNGYFIAGKHAPAGKIISVADDRVYAFGRQPQYYKWTTPMEFRLFSARKEWASAPRKPAPTPAPAPKGKAGKGRAKKAGKKAGSQGRGGGPVPVGYQKNYHWIQQIPILVRAMVLADKTLFVAGPADVLNEAALGRLATDDSKEALQQEAALAGRRGALLWAVSARTGEKLGQVKLASPPVFDGMAAARGRLFLATLDGHVVCLGGAK